MARIVITETNDALLGGLLLGSAIGVVLATIVWAPGNPNVVIVTAALFAPLAFFSLIGRRIKSYRSECSCCNVDLTRFIEHPCDPPISYCPVCGVRLTNSESPVSGKGKLDGP